MTTTRLANSRIGLFLFFVLLGAVAAFCSGDVLSKEPQKSPIATNHEKQPSAVSQYTVPKYNDKGELKLPADFQTWIFVGANMGLEYRDAAAKEATPKKQSEKDGKKPVEKHVKAGNFHYVYINPEAYEQYRKSGTFPEQTMLVLDIYQPEQGEPNSIVSEGLFPGKRKEIAVAVKNSTRPDGSKTDWAYYDFPPDQAAAQAFPNTACYDCHLEHADDDNVWAQFYPTLRKLRQDKGKR